MSKSWSQSSSESAKANSWSESTGLRPLAPKARPLAPRPPSSRSSTGSAQPDQKNTSSKCAVCFKGDCQLLTHKAFGTTVTRQHTLADQQHAVGNREPDAGFMASYAFVLAKQYTTQNIEVSQVDPVYRLPIKPELNTHEMHQLFHDFFAIESSATFRITRPPEIVGDLILSPFFVPAMNDSALCLSILATAAAVIPTRSGMPARNVMSLTLIGETMQQMRERIDADPHQISDATIVAATFLWLINVWLEDREAMESHATSVVTFVTTRGGLGKLGMVGAVAQFIRWTDILSSFMAGQPCRFTDNIDSGPEMAISAPRRYGSFWDVSQTALTGPIHPSVAESCKESCKLMDLLEVAPHEGRSHLSPRQYLYIVQRLCSICIQDTILQVRLFGSSTLDECIFLATRLIRIASFCANDYLRNVMAGRAAEALIAVLQRVTTGLRFWHADIDLLIWLLSSLLLGLAESNLNGREWATNSLLQAVISKFGSPDKWTPSWQDNIAEILRTFGWSDLLLATEFRSTCVMLARAQELDMMHGTQAKGKSVMM